MISGVSIAHHHKGEGYEGAYVVAQSHILEIGRWEIENRKGYREIGK